MTTQTAQKVSSLTLRRHDVVEYGQRGESRTVETTNMGPAGIMRITWQGGEPDTYADRYAWWKVTHRVNYYVTEDGGELTTADINGMGGDELRALSQVDLARLMSFAVIAGDAHAAARAGYYCGASEAVI